VEKDRAAVREDLPEVNDVVRVALAQLEVLWTLNKEH
jgi:hypothetical protein